MVGEGAARLARLCDMTAISAGYKRGRAIVATLPEKAHFPRHLVIVQLLPDWKLAVVEAHAILGNGQAARPAARAFVDHLVEGLPSI